MKWLARWVTHKVVAWAIIVVVLVLTALASMYALRVEQDDDLLAFLPPDNQDVARFHEINRRFGGLDVAIVGIETDDPFDAAFLTDLGTLTRRLNDENPVAFAMSLTNVEDFADDAQGGIARYHLAGTPPKTPAEKEALRKLVMGKEHIVGNLIAPDARSVLIYAFLAPGNDPRASAQLIRSRVDEVFPNHTKYWGGAPFISTYIYDVTYHDMRRLIPWAVLVIVVSIVASFRDVLGALLALGATGVGIVFSYGLMGFRGHDANIVLAAMPVVLFAVGSAYPIPILVRYYELRGTRDTETAMRLSMVQVGPALLGVGLTTVVGLLSYMAMDIVPMQQFGLYTGVGNLLTLGLSFTFVPAVVRVLEVGGRSFKASIYERAAASMMAWARRFRWPLAVALGVASIAGVFFAMRVDARMENAAFFAEGSPPDRAEKFLKERFGGSLFIQVMIEGDMNDPDVLREVQRVADLIAVEPHVSSVNHIATVLALGNEALTGERRVPPTTAGVRLIYRELEGRPAIAQLLDRERRHALIHAKIDTDAHDDVEAVLSAIARIVDREAVHGYAMVGRPPAAEIPDDPNKVPALVPLDAEQKEALAAHRRGLVAARIASGLRARGVVLSAEQLGTLLEALSAAAPVADPSEVAPRLEKFLTSAESQLDSRDPERRAALHALAPALARALAAVAAPSEADFDRITREIIAPAPSLPEGCSLPERRAPAPKRADDDDDDDDDDGADERHADPACASAISAYQEHLADAEAVAGSIGTPLSEIRDQVRSARHVEQVLGALSLSDRPELGDSVSDALLDLAPQAGLVPGSDGGAGSGALTLDYTVSGVPVLYRGLAKSVTANQISSLWWASAPTLLIMILLFRSITAGLLAAVPTTLTLLIIYGLMGLLGMHLDIGTSMLASLIIGVGVDYAVQLLEEWRDKGDDVDRAARRAARKAGPAIITSTLMVAAGFFVLTLGDARPLQNVARLTALAMIAALFATFLAVPVLARRANYQHKKKP